ncbi:hypothetical protein HUG10_00015 [Halorarum halophilum]|uniref:Uncharacterized protein n=1 Tax=Halorarum halophilum TaxID=2743090 RepID=A0A7D5G9Z4_9EURY|nr:hypothetical protein [Halobaculum halophilum]QLG26025.1 hypothetical protein HUG10_00015 [Halobaculum halophilum]
MARGMNREAAVRCGCAGKTPLDRVVLPARERIRSRLADTSVSLGPDRDAALLPRCDRVESDTEVVALNGRAPTGPTDDGEAWTLAAAFAGDRLADSERFAGAVGEAYAALDGQPVTIGKGHAVQVPGADDGALWLEHLRPRGPRRDGVLAASVDVIHGFPGLSPAESLRIAILNACNDLHAVGAVADREVRPLVAAPRGELPADDTVATWTDDSVPVDATALRPATVEHDGGGWLFGASVRAVAQRAPARPPLEPGVEVLLTRPLGGLALFAHGVASDDREFRERGLERLRTDTRPIAEALASFRPDSGEPFDPDRHVARVTDVSGEGVAGIGRVVADAGRSLRVEALPLLPGVDEVADAWTVPDVTVETNGPLAIVARSGALDRVADRLVEVSGSRPTRLGTVVRGGPRLSAAPGCEASRYVERAARWDGGLGERDSA